MDFAFLDESNRGYIPNPQSPSLHNASTPGESNKLLKMEKDIHPRTALYLNHKTENEVEKYFSTYILSRFKEPSGFTLPYETYENGLQNTHMHTRPQLAKQPTFVACLPSSGVHQQH